MTYDEQHKERMAEVAAASERRRKTFVWLDGWKCGAAFLCIPEKYQVRGSEDAALFGKGWSVGRQAKRAANEQAALLFGYEIAVLRLLDEG